MMAFPRPLSDLRRARSQPPRLSSSCSSLLVKPSSPNSPLYRSLSSLFSPRSVELLLRHSWSSPFYALSNLFSAFCRTRPFSLPSSSSRFVLHFFAPSLRLLAVLEFASASSSRRARPASLPSKLPPNSAPVHLSIINPSCLGTFYGPFRVRSHASAPDIGAARLPQRAFPIRRVRLSLNVILNPTP